MAARFMVPILMVLITASSRLIPHPWNFTPITALALFGGVYFSDRRWAFCVPLAAMFLSDSVLGFHFCMPYVYGAVALNVCIGHCLRRRCTFLPLAVATLASGLLFFVVTNFGAWMTMGLYPMTLNGLASCYVAALPFLRNSLAGDVVYTALIFGGFAAYPINRVAHQGIPLGRPLAVRSCRAAVARA